MTGLGKTTFVRLNEQSGYDDRIVASKLLNLHITYYVRIGANDQNLLETLRNWIPYNNTTPDYIFLGLCPTVVRWYYSSIGYS